MMSEIKGKKKKDHDGEVARPAHNAEVAPAAEAGPEPGLQPDWKDKFLRAKADFQNLQRRAEEEQRTAVRYANADFARALLEVLDDFERTLEAAGAGEPTSLVSGVKLVYDKLLKVLKDHHVEPIDALGRPFEPRLHEALMQQPSDEHPPNTVIEQVQKGYMLHDRVLRPARVVVSKPAADPEAVQDGTSADSEH